MTAQQQRAQSLHATGLSYAEIGRRLGVTRGAAYSAVHPDRNAAAKHRYREDAAKAEREREASRRWKRHHLGQPGRRKESDA